MGIIALCNLQLYLPESRSLKDKRAVIKSLLKRIQNKFNVSAAEVEHHDAWQSASISFVTISNESRQAERVVRNVKDWIEANYPQVQILKETIEII